MFLAVAVAVPGNRWTSVRWRRDCDGFRDEGLFRASKLRKKSILSVFKPATSYLLRINASGHFPPTPPRPDELSAFY